MEVDRVAFMKVVALKQTRLPKTSACIIYTALKTIKLATVATEHGNVVSLIIEARRSNEQYYVPNQLLV